MRPNLRSLTISTSPTTFFLSLTCCLRITCVLDDFYNLLVLWGDLAFMSRSKEVRDKLNLDKVCLDCYVTDNSFLTWNTNLAYRKG